MTNELTVSKQEFALALQQAGLRVLDYVPERITPPIVILTAGSPYLTHSAVVRSEYSMGLEATLVASKATNKVETENLDALIEAFLFALPGYAKMDSVGTPFDLSANNANYLAATVNLQIEITI